VLIVIGVTFGFAALVRSSSLALAPASANSPPSSPSQGKSIVPAQIVQDHVFYTESCAVCHGAGGRGCDGSKLIGLGISDKRIAETIRDGNNGAMLAFGKSIKSSKP